MSAMSPSDDSLRLCGNRLCPRAFEAVADLRCAQCGHATDAQPAPRASSAVAVPGSRRPPLPEADSADRAAAMVRRCGNARCPASFDMTSEPWCARCASPTVLEPAAHVISLPSTTDGSSRQPNVGRLRRSS